MKAMELDKLLVKDIMSPPELTVDKGDTVSEVINRMKKAKVREIPVLDGKKPVGLISYSSFFARRNVPLTAKAEHIMIPCPKLEEDMKVIRAAEELMSAGVRGAPVVRNHKMVGFVSRTDFVEVVPKIDQLKDKPVSEVMSIIPQTVTENEPVRKAQVIMKSLNEKTLPVVDGEGTLVGAIGMTDVLDVIWAPRAAKPPNEILGSREPADVKVGSVMSRSPTAIEPSTTLEEAADIMIDKKLTTLFVVDEGKLVGVVSQTDLIEQMVSLRPREGVYVQMTGLDLEDPEIYDVLYDLIGKSMKRIDRIQSPRVFTVHVSVYHNEGMKSKYSLGGRLTTEKGMYYAKAVDWDLYKAMNTLLDVLEHDIRKDHERQIDEKKRRRSNL